MVVCVCAAHLLFDQRHGLHRRQGTVMCLSAHYCCRFLVFYVAIVCLIMCLLLLFFLFVVRSIAVRDV